MRGHRASGDFFVLIPLKGQPTIGGVRLVFSLFFIIFASQHDPGNDTLSFMCHPETSDVHKEKCFAQYTAEMSPFMRPYLFFIGDSWYTVCLVDFNDSVQFGTFTKNQKSDRFQCKGASLS